MSDDQDTFEASRRTYGQSALAWSANGRAHFLTTHGCVITLESEPEDLFDWHKQKPPGDGIWIWEGWARIVDGGPEYPQEAEMQIGGEFRRLNEGELARLGAGLSVFKDAT